MSIPGISEAIIRHNSNASSYSRGEEYYRKGAIPFLRNATRTVSFANANLKKRGNLIQAEVEGGEITPYQVSIRFDAGGITSACCTCPYDYDGWCKHIVATLLSCSRQSEIIEERPTLEQLLNRLDLLQTQRLLQELVENRPEIIDDIDEFVSLIDLPKPKTKQPSTRQSKIDTSPFRSHVKRILRDGLKELEYGSELVHRVMDAAVSHRPDWVIDNARRRAEPIMEQGKADRYDAAVNWLKKAKSAYLQLGQKAEWSAYRSQLEAAHGRKRKLMELFKELNK